MNLLFIGKRHYTYRGAMAERAKDASINFPCTGLSSELRIHQIGVSDKV